MVGYLLLVVKISQQPLKSHSHEDSSQKADRVKPSPIGPELEHLGFQLSHVAHNGPRGFPWHHGHWHLKKWPAVRPLAAMKPKRCNANYYDSVFQLAELFDGFAEDLKRRRTENQSKPPKHRKFGVAAPVFHSPKVIARRAHRAGHFLLLHPAALTYGYEGPSESFAQ